MLAAAQVKSLGSELGSKIPSANQIGSKAKSAVYSFLAFPSLQWIDSKLTKIPMSLSIASSRLPGHPLKHLAGVVLQTKDIGSKNF